MINGIKTEDIDKIINSKEELKLDNGTFKLRNEVIDIKEVETKDNETLRFDKLTNKQKATLRAYGITDQNTFDEFLCVKGNAAFKEKKIRSYSMLTIMKQVTSRRN